MPVWDDPSYQAMQRVQAKSAHRNKPSRQKVPVWDDLHFLGLIVLVLTLPTVM